MCIRATFQSRRLIVLPRCASLDELFEPYSSSDWATIGTEWTLNRSWLLRVGWSASSSGAFASEFAIKSSDMYSAIPTLQPLDNPDPVGLVLLTKSFQPVYFNNVAASVLCYPEVPARAEERRGRVLTALRKYVLPSSEKPAHSSTKITSGKRQYMCRVLELERNEGAQESPACAVLLERVSRRDDCLRRLFHEFKLTPREREAVALLMDGFTSKEIAQKMCVSPNTVKAFLHCTMLKMGVTTRSGIIGKVAIRRLGVPEMPSCDGGADF
jgi:DNA-binding CsgD family transcriptional regulator